MIIIEKLRKHSNLRTRYSSVGIIDFYHSDLRDPDVPHFWHCYVYNLRDRAERYLENNGILLAKHRGPQGVAPWELDQFENDMRSRYGNDVQFVYDVDFREFIALPRRVYWHIANTRTLLFSDLIEGTMCKSTVWEQLDLPDRTKYFLSCNLNAANAPEGRTPGMVTLPWANSFASVTICNHSTEHLLDDPEPHLKKIDQLYDQSAPGSFLSLNGKPRTPRLEFLAQAWRRGLLDNAIWSLGYYPHEVKVDTSKEYLSVGHRAYSQNVDKMIPYRDFIDAFSWPRLLSGDILIEFEDLVKTPLDLMDQVDWHVVIETTVTTLDDPFFNTETHSTLVTEKFYKAIIMGHPVIPIGWKNCDYDIRRRAGYHLPDIDWSYLRKDHWHQRLEGALDLLENLGDKTHHRQRALDNFERIIDKDQLVRDVCEPLLHIKEAPASTPN